MSVKRVSGIITALLTPLKRDLSLNENGLESLIRFQAEKGIRNFFVMGTYGEGVALPLRTRRELISKLADILPSRSFAIVHVGSADPEAALELARLAGDLGFKAVSSLGPIYHRPTTEALIGFYDYLSKAGADLIIYNNRGRQGYNISPDAFEAIASEVPAVSGIKDTSYDIEQLQEYVERFGSRYFVAGAGDNLIYHTFAVGAAAHICGISNAFPELPLKLYRSFKEGRYADALTIQSRINRIRKILKRFPVESPEVVREVLKLRGIDAGEPPFHIGGLDEKRRSELGKALAPILRDIENL